MTRKRKLFWACVLLITITVSVTVLINFCQGIAFYRLQMNRAETWYELTDKKIYPGNIDGVVVSKGGLSYISPWGELVELIGPQSGVMKHSFDGEVSVHFSFRNQDWYSEIYSPFIKSKTFERMFGEDLSIYEIRKTIFETNPDNHKQNNTIKENWIILRMLELKALTVSEAEKGIYSFETPFIKGFQFGTVDLVGYAKLEIYLGDSKFLYVSIHGATQEEVEQFLSSFNYE